MKIIAIGDFHGKFPEKLIKKIKKENIDLILSTGDFCGNNELQKLFFKYAYGTNKELWEFIGKRKAGLLDKKNFLAGKKILKKLARLNKKAIGVRGNWDPVNWQDIGFPGKRDAYSKRFNELIKKSGLKIIDFKNYKFSDYNFVGYPRSTYPGKVTKHIEKKIRKREGKKAGKVIKKIKEDNKKFFKKLRGKFQENTIFISHNCPYNTKLDKVKKGVQKGKHYGSWLAKKLVQDLKPFLVICGHMHENQGKCRIGKSLIINPGAAYEGKAAIIEIKKNKVKNVKFLR